MAFAHFPVWLRLHFGRRRCRGRGGGQQTVGKYNFWLFIMFCSTTYFFFKKLILAKKYWIWNFLENVCNFWWIIFLLFLAIVFLTQHNGCFWRFLSKKYLRQVTTSKKSEKSGYYCCHNFWNWHDKGAYTFFWPFTHWHLILWFVLKFFLDKSHSKTAILISVFLIYCFFLKNR